LFWPDYIFIARGRYGEIKHPIIIRIIFSYFLYFLLIVLPDVST
ncbi:unnamed protein product, partial [Brassica rapa subsp. trilocularis]